MAETYEEYKERVLGYLGDQDPVVVLRSTPLRLEKMIEWVPPRALARNPAPGKWSVTEIIAHLADAELALAWRFRNMIATPGAQLQWWDEHLWSEKLNYQAIPWRESFGVFQALRRSNLALLRSLPREMWDSLYGVHEKRGRQTLTDFVTMEAAHDLNHLIQVEALTATLH